jgi:hypothetical protein
VSVEAGQGGFWSGLAAGALTGVVVVLIVVLVAGDQLPGVALTGWSIERSLSWAHRNLGLSLPIFGVVLALYLKSLFDLRTRIETARRVDEVAHADHLTDTWTSLFFGVGVIWTAIGMRGALLYALGDPNTSFEDGAFAILQRMVDGGILVALSTTIFGGIGGYVMRVAKTIVVGAPLKRYYDDAAQVSSLEVQNTLGAIERHLASLTQSTASERAGEQATVA